jgi:hypothetical protein
MLVNKILKLINLLLQISGAVLTSNKLSFVLKDNSSNFYTNLLYRG